MIPVGFIEAYEACEKGDQDCTSCVLNKSIKVVSSTGQKRTLVLCDIAIALDKLAMESYGTDKKAKRAGVK